MKYILIAICFIVSGCKIIFNSGDDFKLKYAEGFPKWLADGKLSADQTSGLTFIRSEKNGSKLFLIADDIGFIRKLTVSKKGDLSLRNISFSKEAQKYLDALPKKDFEEITFDRKEEEFYLSIEGNYEEYLKYAGIYKFKFEKGISSGVISTIEKLNIKPDSIFKKYLRSNIGYEGLAADDDYLYLGLEGIFANKYFSKGSVIFIVDKRKLTIVKEIRTKEFGIYTISGLCAQENRKIWGVDRNGQKIFFIQFDEDLNPVLVKKSRVPIRIPGYPEREYSSALESITIDDENNLYLVDDPYYKNYAPSKKIMEKLDEETRSNFKKLVPIIHKFIIQ